MAQFRAMTWNVENLFGVGAESGPATEADLVAKIESLRAVIDARQPDVVALHELGPEDVVERLQQALMTPMPTPGTGDRGRPRDPGRVHQPPAAA
jgi:hypothetical protein